MTNRVIEVVKRGQKGADGNPGLLGVSIKAANADLTEDERAYAIRCTAAVTLTLDLIANLTPGWSCIVDATNGAVTVETSGSDTIDGASSITVPSQRAAYVYTDGNDFYSREMGAGGGLVNVQVFDTAGSDTYTPTAGATRAEVIVIGGGGAGGGADGDSAGSQGGVGGGGGAGAAIHAYITLDAATYAVVVGAAGVAVSAANGGNGGASSLTSNGDSGAGLTLSAPGGVGGTATIDTNTGSASGGTGGAVSTVTGTSIVSSISHNGARGGVGFFIISDEIATGDGIAVGGQGSASLYAEAEGAPTIAGDGLSTAGFDSDGNGGGGSGAVALGATTAVAGGAGGPGIVVIREYSA